MAWFDFLNQANPAGRDAGSIARQRLSARGAIPAAKPGLPRGAGLGTGAIVGSLLGDYVAAPLAVGFGDYLRTGQGQLLKDRLRQGDIGGAFTAVTGIGRNNAPVLKQYNPPGFVPGSQVTSADILQSATEVGKRRQDKPQPGDTQPPVPTVFDPYAAQNRAYQQERARVEAMVKANPDMQKQEIADARAKVRDQGMAIWQEKYGSTPMGQPGGAVGMNNPLMDRNFGYQTGGAPDQQMGAPTLGPSPLVPQVDQSLNPASPNFIGGEGPPLMNFADPRFENMSPEEFQKLLNQVNKK